MTTQRTDRHRSLGGLDLRAKREYLVVLSDVDWDIETELAQAEAERAALESSLQADLRLAGWAPVACRPSDTG